MPRTLLPEPGLVYPETMLVYLHGLNSGGGSAKAAWLRQNLAPIPVLSPTYPVERAEAAADFLQAYLVNARLEHPEDERLVLVGSSLGGFYAQYLAPQFDARLVLINPAIYPERDLRNRLGPNRNPATGEDYLLTEDDVRAFERLRIPCCNPQVPTLVLLDEGDELLDYREAEAFYRGCGKILVYPGGNHRFEHLPQAGDEIVRLHDT